MTPNLVRGAARCIVALAAAALFASPAMSQQATTTGTIRGVVTGPSGTPMGSVTVIATNTESGNRRGALSDDQGRYAIPFLDPGSYTVRAQFIGYRAVEKPGITISLGSLSKVDFTLQQAVVTLGAQTIIADQIPLIEATKTGTNTRIDQEQISALPLNGRNFKDLVVLAPGVSDLGNPGSGGSQSIGGGRQSMTNVTMDGTNNNESFFGGDARGGDRAPFSYSIEAIKEIQVITSSYDVEQGNFTGGMVNAVTRAGTNKFSGAVFGYLRKDTVDLLGLKFHATGDDFANRKPTQYQKAQYGVRFGGPIVKDKMHFLFTLDQQTARDPLLVIQTGGLTGDAGIRAAGMNPDTLANFVRIAKDVYGYDLSGEIGNFYQYTNESAVFARYDWQINDRHHFTFRDNYTNLKTQQDRLAVGSTATDLKSNAGDNIDIANSAVVALTSVFGALSNELRVQSAYENKPRPSNPSGTFGIPMPQVRVSGIRSVLSDGSTITDAVTFGADPILHGNDIKTKTTELINNVRYSRGDHTYKVYGSYLHVDAFDKFQNNALGSFTFASTADFENKIPSGFTRAIPFTGKTKIDDGDYVIGEYAIGAQDEFQVNPRLFLVYGLRWDYASYPKSPQFNADLANQFPGLDTRVQPVDNNNVSPRVGFTFDPGANGNQVIRGGTGVFYGRNPYVIYNNALVATGFTQLQVSCAGAASPIPDFPSYKLSQGNIPTACLGGGAASAGAPEVVVFTEDYQQQYAWKVNLAWDRKLSDRWRFTLEHVYSMQRDGFLVQDDNLNTTPRFTIEGGIPIYVDPTTISTTNGSVSKNNSRRFTNFASVYVHRSLGSAQSNISSFQIQGRHRWGSLHGTYTYDRTSDNGSLGCCITNSMFQSGFTRGNPNDYNEQWAAANYNRRHTFVLSPIFRLKYGVELSGIMRMFSGTAWTPRYNFDINGDGISNDRVYIPTRADMDTMRFAGATAQAQATNKSVIESGIESIACLREHRGEIAKRNSCRNGWTNLVDLRLAKKFSTLRGQNFEVVADFINLLNGLNQDWGRRMDIPFANTSLLTPAGFDPATKKFLFSGTTTLGKPAGSAFATQQFQMQLGLRYNF